LIPDKLKGIQIALNVSFKQFGIEAFHIDDGKQINLPDGAKITKEIF